LKTVCVFVSSSDNTRDIFLQVSRSFEKNWPDCPFLRYVGLNSSLQDLPAGFRSVLSPESRWPKELYGQICRLPQQIRYILLFLDDFLILSRVDTQSLVSLVERAIQNRLAYLRLIPQSRAILSQLGKKIYYLYRPETIEAIGKHAPYCSSLQVALWERNHLSLMLKAAQNIWDFENTYLPGIKHYAVIEHRPINYVHVVEKGCWQHNAASLFKTAGLSFDPSGRKVRSMKDRIVFWINKVKFAVIGYTVFRLKRRAQKKVSI